MSIQLYQVAHIFSVILLAGIVFAALAAPQPENRRFMLMSSGIVAVVALVSGFGLLALGRFGFPGWIIVKMVCWLALSGLVGFAFRRPAQQQALTAIAVVVVLIAVGMVVMKPF